MKTFASLKLARICSAMFTLPPPLFTLFRTLPLPLLPPYITLRPILRTVSVLQNRERRKHEVNWS